MRRTALHLLLGEGVEVAGGAGRPLGDGQLPVRHDPAADRLDVKLQPVDGVASLGIVGRTVVVDPPDLAKEIVLGEFLLDVRIVHGVGLAPVALHDGEAGDIARAVGNVDHVLERNPAILGLDVGIDLDRGVFVRALVDLEEGPGLGRIVDHHPDLGDLGLRRDLELLLAQEPRLQGALDEFATPDSVDKGGDGAALDHPRETGADDVVLDLDLVLLELGLFQDPVLGVLKESGQARIKDYLGAGRKKHLVVQSRHPAGKDIRQEMIEVADFARKTVTPLVILLDQGVYLCPKRGLVNVVPAEQRLLHVPGNQCLVEIPNAGDDVLGEKRRGHRCLRIRTGIPLWRQTLLGSVWWHVLDGKTRNEA